MLELRACAEGMVQGVGLRATVRKHADTHELKGFVRNLPDGRVEFVLMGNQTVLPNEVKPKADAAFPHTPSGESGGKVNRSKCVQPKYWLIRVFIKF